MNGWDDLNISDNEQSEDSFASQFAKIQPYNLRSGVFYKNALSLAKDLDIGFGTRYDVVVSGNFVFGDFIEALFVEKNIKAVNMQIATLSLSKDNIISLHNLIKGG